MTGNCLKGSRPVLSFSKHFDSAPHLRLLREMVTTVRSTRFQRCSGTRFLTLTSHTPSPQSFGTPRGHPKSQPFVDHVLCVSWLDNKIWFRNYQVMSRDQALWGWCDHNNNHNGMTRLLCLQIVDTATDKSAVRRVLKDGDSPVTLVEIGPR